MVLCLIRCICIQFTRSKGCVTFGKSFRYASGSIFPCEIKDSKCNTRSEDRFILDLKSFFTEIPRNLRAGTKETKKEKT